MERVHIEPPDELLNNRSDPDARLVLEDWRLSQGERPTRLGVALWIWHSAADAAAAAAADAAAAAAADAAAADAADAAAADAADAEFAILIGDIDVTNGLKIIQIPGRYYSATFIAWIRRVSGDEYEMLPGACAIGRSSGVRLLTDLAVDGPKDDHKVFAPAKSVEEFHRLAVRRCVAADEKIWREYCPKPKGWEASK